MGIVCTRFIDAQIRCGGITLPSRRAGYPAVPVPGATRPVPFALAALATWRLTHLIVAEDGPAEVVVRLRRAAGAGVVGQAMDCFYCASVWVALPVAAALTYTPRAGAHRW